MIKLSVVIITFNEEKNIERCLKSVQDIAEEILVLDSFSVDKTEEICKSFNVKFHQQEFENFAKQKNYAVSLASNDLVLSLDADEVLSEELIESIKEIKLNSNYEGYIFNRLNIYCNKPIKYTTWYPDKKLRLWDRRKGEWDSDIHETVKMNEGSTTKRIKGDLLHYSFNSIEEHIAQANRFSTLSAENIVKKKKKNLLFKALVNPFVRFFRNYFIKFGFLGGYIGFMLSIIISFETFLKYSKAISLKRKLKDS